MAIRNFVNFEARVKQWFSKMKRFPVVELKERVSSIFVKAGVDGNDARILADTLVTTDMRGVYSHGVIRCARYLDCIKVGGIQPANQPIVFNSTANSLQVSANGGLGIIASVKTLDQLLEKAKGQPVSIATVNHSDHYGAAGYYSMRGADAGFLTFSMSNTCPLVAPTGGRASTIGNNPFAYSAPGNKYRAVLFDICMSKVASGKIQIAAEEGHAIPDGWILDREGRPTTNPKEIYNGAIMLPFAEHKGYGFAVMVEILTGILAGAAMMSGVHSWNEKPGRDANTGHCFMAINPEFFGGTDVFKSKIDSMIDELKSCTPMNKDCPVLYPGELEAIREKDAMENGVPLPEASVAELQRAEKIFF